MIEPITKEYFYKKLGAVEDTSKWRKIKEFMLINIDPSRFGFNGILYFEKLESAGVFVYLHEYKMLLIPENFPDLEISPDEEISFNNWKVEDAGKTDPRYTINVFHRASEYYYRDDTLEALKEFPPRARIRLRNDRIGYKIELEILQSITSWSKTLYIGYPEKLNLPFDSQKVFQKDKELRNIILWTQKK